MTHKPLCAAPCRQPWAQSWAEGSGNLQGSPEQSEEGRQGLILPTTTVLPAPPLPQAAHDDDWTSHRIPVSHIYYTDPYNHVGSVSNVTKINKLISKSHALGLNQSHRPSGCREGVGASGLALCQRQKDRWPGPSGCKALPSKLQSLQHLALCLKFCSNPCTVVCILSSHSSWQGIWWKKSWMSHALRVGRDRLTFPEWKTKERPSEGLKVESTQREGERNYFVLSNL